MLEHLLVIGGGDTYTPGKQARNRVLPVSRCKSSREGGGHTEWCGPWAVCGREGVPSPNKG